jgi:hypothetical protein
LRSKRDPTWQHFKRANSDWDSPLNLRVRANTGTDKFTFLLSGEIPKTIPTHRATTHGYVDNNLLPRGLPDRLNAYTTKRAYKKLVFSLQEHPNLQVSRIDKLLFLASHNVIRLDHLDGFIVHHPSIPKTHIPKN